MFHEISPHIFKNIEFCSSQQQKPKRNLLLGLTTTIKVIRRFNNLLELKELIQSIFKLMQVFKMLSIHTNH